MVEEGRFGVNFFFLIEKGRVGDEARKRTIWDDLSVGKGRLGIILQPREDDLESLGFNFLVDLGPFSRSVNDLKRCAKKGDLGLLFSGARTTWGHYLV